MIVKLDMKSAVKLFAAVDVVTEACCLFKYMLYVELGFFFLV